MASPLSGYTGSSQYQPLKYESLAKKISAIDAIFAAKKKGTSNVDVTTLFQSPTLPPSAEDISQVAWSPSGELLTPSNMGVPLGSAERQALIPSDYLSKILPTDEQLRWVAPGDRSFFAALPERTGGGQFVVDPAQVDKIIKSTRGDTTTDEMLTRGGLSPRLYEIDHIVPLWAGGAGTKANKQLLDVYDHAQKTNVDAVARALYFNGDISLVKARAMATIDWRNLDTKNIVPDEVGEVPLDVARAKYAEWQAVPKVSFVDTLKETPKSIMKILSTAEKFLPTPVQNAIEGAITGFSGGWIPTEAGNEQFIFADPDFDPGTAGKVADQIGRYAGQVGGTILSFIALKGLVGRLGKITGLTKLWANSSLARAPLIRVAGSKTGAEYIFRNTSLAGILENMGLFALHGQLSKPEVESFQYRTTKLLKDMRDGAFFGLVSPIPNKYTGAAALGVGTYTLRRLDGATNEEAFLDATTMAGLHLAFRWKMPEEQRQQYLQDLATKKAIDFRTKYLGRPPGESSTLEPAVRSVDSVTGRLETKVTRGEETLTIGQYPGGKVEVRGYNQETMDAENKIIFGKIADLWSKGKIKSDAEVDALLQETILSGRHLYKQSLARDARWIEDLRDFFSLGEKVKRIPVTDNTKTPVATDTTLPDQLRLYVDKNPNAGNPTSEVGLQIPTTAFTRKPITGEMSITGVGETGFLAGSDIVPEANKNLKEVAKIRDKTPDRVAPNILLVLDDSPAMQTKVNAVNNELRKKVQAGEIKPEQAFYYQNPENVVTAYAVVDGTPVQVGHFPRQERIGSPVYDDKGILVSVDGMPNNKNQWIVDFNKKTGYNLPLLDPSFNSDNLANFMRENKLSVIEAPIVKMSAKGAYSQNPQLIYELKDSNYLEAYAKNQGIATPTVEDKTWTMRAIQDTLPVNASDYIKNLGIKDSILVNQLEDVLGRFETLLKEGNAKNMQVSVNEMFGDGFFKDAREAQKWIDNKYDIKVSDVFSGLDNVAKLKTLTLQGQTCYDHIIDYFGGRNLTTAEKQRILMTSLLTKTLESDVKTEGRKMLVREAVRKLKEQVTKPITKRVNQVKAIQKFIKERFKPSAKAPAPGQLTISEAIKKAKTVAPTIAVNIPIRVEMPKPLVVQREKQQPMSVKEAVPKAQVVVKGAPEVKTTMTTKEGIKLAKQIVPSGNYWLEQNIQKAAGKWTPLAKTGHKVEHLMLKSGGYAGKIRIDGEIYDYPEAEEKFLQPIVQAKAVVRPPASMRLSLREQPEVAEEVKVEPIEQPSQEIEKANEELKKLETDVVLPEEAPELKVRAFREYEGGMNKGFDNVITERQIALYGENKPKEITALQKFKQEFTKTKLIQEIKQYVKDNVTLNAEQVFDKYWEVTAEKLSQHGIRPLSNTEKQVVKRNFYWLAESTPRNTFSINESAKVGAGESYLNIRQSIAEAKSVLDDKIESARQEMGLAKDSMQPVYFDMTGSKFAGYNRSGMQQKQIIKNALIRNGYVPMGVTGNSLETFFAVKYDPKIVERYNQNPEKYQNRFNEPRTNNDKFIRVFLRDVLGLPKDITQKDVMKRWKIVNSHQLINKAPKVTYKHYILKSPTFADIKQLNTELNNTKFAENITPENINTLRNRNLYDGKIFMSRELANEITKANGFVGTRNHLKPTTYHTWQDGGEPYAFAQKGDIIVLDSTSKAVFEKWTGQKLGKYDVITFEDNVKIGLDAIDKTIDNPKFNDQMPSWTAQYKTFDVPSDAYRFEHLGLPSSHGSLALATIAKFSNADNLNESFGQLFKPHVEKFMQFTREVKDAKGANALREVFNKEKYKEYVIDMDKNLYDSYKALWKLGAGNRRLNKQIDSLLNKLWKNKIMNGAFLKSAHLYTTPDFGYLKNGKQTYLSSNEIMVSANTAKRLGVNEGDYALTLRYPVSRKLAMSKDRILIAEDHGVRNLGKENIMTSFFNTYARKEGDFDGDSIHIFKVGGGDGISKSIVDKIEEERAAQGDVIINVEANKYEDKASTVENFDEITDAMMIGIDGINITSATARIMPMIVDNGLQIKFVPEQIGQDTHRVEISLGNHKIAPEEFKNIFNIKTPYVTLRGVGNLTITPKWGQKENLLMTTVLQEAVDSSKTPALRDRGWNNNYLTARLFEVNGPDNDRVTDMDDKSGFKYINNKEILSVLGSAMRPLQEIFGIAQRDGTIRSNEVLNNILQKTIGLTDLVKSGDGKLTPVQSIVRLFKNFEPYTQEDRTVIFKADQVAVQAVKDKFEGKVKDDLEKPRVKEFIAKAREINQVYNPPWKPELATDKQYQAELQIKRKALRQDLINYYKKNEASYTPEEKEAISYWVLTSPWGNITYAPTTKKFYYQGTGNIYRLDEVITEDQGREYYKAFEEFKP